MDKQRAKELRAQVYILLQHEMLMQSNGQNIHVMFIKLK